MRTDVTLPVTSPSSATSPPRQSGTLNAPGGLRVTFSKEGLAQYRGEVVREESTQTFRWSPTPTHATQLLS